MIEESEEFLNEKKVLCLIALITVFVPLTAVLVWKPTAPAATAIIIGYCIFAALSFLYVLFLFVKMKFRDIFIPKSRLA